MRRIGDAARILSPQRPTFRHARALLWNLAFQCGGPQSTAQSDKVSQSAGLSVLDLVCRWRCKGRLLGLEAVEGCGLLLRINLA
jgi:hypothetical protein